MDWPSLRIKCMGSSENFPGVLPAGLSPINPLSPSARFTLTNERGLYGGPSHWDHLPSISQRKVLSSTQRAPRSAAPQRGEHRSSLVRPPTCLLAATRTSHRFFLCVVVLFFFPERAPAF